MNITRPIEDVNESLSPWHREILSQDAQRVYAAIALRMKSLSASEIRLSDDDLSRRARVVLPRIHPAKVEIVKSGLLHLTPCLDNKTQYTKFDSDELEAEEK